MSAVNCTAFKHPEFVPDTEALLGEGLAGLSAVDVVLHVTNNSQRSAAMFVSEAAEVCIIEASITRYDALTFPTAGQTKMDECPTQGWWTFLGFC